MIQFQNVSISIQGIGDENDSLLSVLKAEIDELGYERISSCAAYASRRGVTLVRGLISSFPNATYRWILGLDDTFTDPEALKIAMRTHKSNVRVAQLLTQKPRRRFHPKAYLLDSNGEDESTLIVGSCNLTERALKSNCEVFSVYRAQTSEDVERTHDYWNQLWAIEEDATDSIVARYEERFRRTPRHEPTIQEEISTEKPSEELKTAIEESIATTTLAWIELGSNTGGGNQLDIVKNLAPILGLPNNPSQGDHEFLNIRTSEGLHTYQLTFTKGMWRFMNLQQGFPVPLRPDLTTPSPYTLVINRSEDNSLSMQVVTSRKRLAAISSESGFIGRSTRGPSARLYGWF